MSENNYLIELKHDLEKFQNMFETDNLSNCIIDCKNIFLNNYPNTSIFKGILKNLTEKEIKDFGEHLKLIYILDFDYINTDIIFLEKSCISSNLHIENFLFPRTKKNIDIKDMEVFLNKVNLSNKISNEVVCRINNYIFELNYVLNIDFFNYKNLNKKNSNRLALFCFLKYYEKVNNKTLFNEDFEKIIFCLNNTPNRNISNYFTNNKFFTSAPIEEVVKIIPYLSKEEKEKITDLSFDSERFAEICNLLQYNNIKNCLKEEIDVSEVGRKRKI